MNASSPRGSTCATTCPLASVTVRSTRVAALASPTATTAHAVPRASTCVTVGVPACAAACSYATRSASSTGRPSRTSRYVDPSTLSPALAATVAHAPAVVVAYVPFGRSTRTARPTAS
ncbi:MAG: hypothetical protein IPL61_38405 [Myxococcales bacterium]|nr:hypothetical protein [Myxococcales bacterium]